MKKICKTIFLALISLTAFSQAPVENSVNLKGQRMTFLKGDRIKINKGGSTYTIEVGDSAWYILETKQVLSFEYLKEKSDSLESLVDNYRKLSRIQDAKLDLYARQLELEVVTLDSLSKISQEKYEIAQLTIKGLRQARFESVIFSGLVGLVGGAIWAADTDKAAWKPLALGGSAAILSWKFKIGKGGFD